jgi:tetratricopeptide (TPR) repeat protein
MHNNRLLILLSLLFTVLTAGAGVKRNDVERCVLLYEEALANYCGSGRHSDKKKGHIYSVCDHDASRLTYPFDLFNDEGAKGGDIDNYLDAVRKNYNNELDVQFDNDNMFIANCVAEQAGVKYVYVTVRKTVRYVGSNPVFRACENSVTLLIAVDVTQTPYKISFVDIPEEYHFLDESCKIARDKYPHNDLSAGYIAKGKSLIADKDYIYAANCFEKALIYKPQSVDAKKGLNLCAEHISFEDRIGAAEGQFNMGDYFNARNQFMYLYQTRPGIDTAHLALQIARCDSAIKLQHAGYYFDKGNYLYKKGCYKAAIDCFDRCRAFMVAGFNEDCLQMIEKCRLLPDALADTIRNAEYLAEHGKKAEAFSILSSCEESGLLSAQNYYFMAMMMDGKDDKVARVMDYSNKECKYFARIYCLRAIQKGSAPAKQLWESRMLKNR